MRAPGSLSLCVCVGLLIGSSGVLTFEDKREDTLDTVVRGVKLEERES